MRSSPMPASRSAARPASLPRAGERRRQTIDGLRKLQSQLDRLIYDYENGPLSQRQHDIHVDCAEGMAAELRALFRGTGRPVHPPLQLTAVGRRSTGLW